LELSVVQVIGPFRLNAAQNISPAANTSRTSGTQPREGVGQASATRSSSPTSIDQLDLSAAGRAAASGATASVSAPATIGGDMRLDKVADLRRQIASGSYDTPEKFEFALGRMLDDIG
jgi:negative regulator of flagellin synthesis FlgM